jgi:hypothetical protein
MKKPAAAGGTKRSAAAKPKTGKRGKVATEVAGAQPGATLRDLLVDTRVTQSTGEVADEHETTDSMKDAGEDEDGHEEAGAAKEDADEDQEEEEAAIAEEVSTGTTEV